MSSSHDIAVRPVTEDEIPAWLNALNTGFLRAPESLSEQELKNRSAHIDPPRTLAAFDESRTHAPSPPPTPPRSSRPTAPSRRS